MLPTPKIKWNVNSSSLKRISDIYISNSLNSVQDALDTTARLTADLIKNDMIFKGSPTGSIWHQIINDYRGNQPGARIDSGAMIDSVGSEVVRSGMGRFLASYGLQTPQAGGEDYFMKQEYGFPLTLPSGEIRNVPGMNTAERSAQFMEKRLRKEMLRAGFLKGRSDWRGERILKLMERGSNLEDAWVTVNTRSGPVSQGTKEHFAARAARQAEAAAIAASKLSFWKNELTRLGNYESYVKRKF